MEKIFKYIYIIVSVLLFLIFFYINRDHINFFFWLFYLKALIFTILYFFCAYYLYKLIIDFYRKLYKWLMKYKKPSENLFKYWNRNITDKDRFHSLCIIIGNNDAEKNSVVINAELDNHAEKTPDVNIKLFKENPIVCDTSEKFIDSSATENEWKQFLNIVKKCRMVSYKLDRSSYSKKVAKFCLIVTIKYADLMNKNFSKYGERLYEIINNMVLHFNNKFPVYIMITKCEELDGMNDYMSLLIKDEDQAIGLMNQDPIEVENDVYYYFYKQNIKNTLFAKIFPEDKVIIINNYQEHYNNQINNFIEKFKYLRLELLSKNSISKAEDILLLPHKIEEMKTYLYDFINTIFYKDNKLNRNEEVPILRGIYFCGDYVLHD